jgi:hypothetical protein
MLDPGSCGGTMGRLAAVAVVAMFVAGCVTAQGDSASLTPPKNYRQQVAAKLRQMEDPSVIQYVGITEPKMIFVGLFNGGTRPAVCVQVERPNIFGARAAWYYLFYFENGQADGFKKMPSSAFEAALAPCEPPLTQMTDLVRSGR